MRSRKDLRHLKIFMTALAIALVFSSCASLNEAPNISNPSPEDGATNVPVNIVLSWSASDPDGDPLKFDVYFGTESNPPLVATDLTDSSYDPGQLEYSTTYYWKVVAKDDHGNSTESPVWKFTTVESPSTPSSPPENPNPSNGAQEVQEFLTLSWEGPSATYTVYLSRVREYVEEESSMAVVGTTTSTNLELSFRLDYDTTYYWKVVAQMSDGSTIESEIWSFETRENPNSDKVFMTKSTFGSYYYNYLTVFKTEGKPIGTTFLGREYLGTFKVLSDKMYALYTEDSKTKVVVYDVSDPMNLSILEEKTFDVYLVPEKVFIMKDRILVLDTHNLNAIYSLDLETGDYGEIIDNVWYAFLEDNLLFVGASGPKFKIYNVSNPDSPVLLREVETFGMDFYPSDFVVDGNRILKITNNGLEIYDLETLEKIDSIDTGLNESVEDFVYNDGRLAVKSIDHIMVFDVSNPSSPSILRSIEASADGFYVQGDVLIYSNSEGLTIIDMESSNVVYSGNRLLGVFGDRLKVAGGKLFTSGYVMNVVDVSNPHLPNLITAYDLGYASPRFNKSIDIEIYENRIFASLELPSGYKGLVVFDFDGSNLTLVSTPISDQGFAPLLTNVELVGDTIYVNRYSPGEIYSVDVDTLATSLVSSLPSNAWSMTSYDDKLYVSMVDGTILVYDLENPDSSWRINIETTLQNTMKSDGNYLYGKSAESNNFYIIDLSNGNIVYNGYLGTMGDFIIDGNRLYALDSYYLKIYDITDRSSPTEVSSIKLLDLNYYGIYKSGDILYITGMAPLWIVDVSGDEPKPIFNDTTLDFDKMDN